jgi:hypothetical protein
MKTTLPSARQHVSAESDLSPRVIQSGDKWIIAANFRQWQARSQSPVRNGSCDVFDVWDGNNWWAQVALAMNFETQAEAEARLTIDRFRM